MTMWWQVEFYSLQERRWVPLFSRETNSNEAAQKAREWLAGTRSRVVRVTQTVEVEWESA